MHYSSFLGTPPITFLVVWSITVCTPLGRREIVKMLKRDEHGKVVVMGEGRMLLVDGMHNEGDDS